MKKLTILLLVLTMLSMGAWLVLKYSPASLSFLPRKEQAAPVPLVKPTGTEYLNWRDSLDRMDILVRTELDPRLLKMHKERQAYFWNKLQASRQMIQAFDSVQTTQKATANPTDAGLVKYLSKVLTVTALVLFVLILILLLLLRRKRVALTRHLEALKEDQRFQGNRSGFVEDEDPRIPIRKAPRAAAAYTSSPNRMADTGALDLSPLQSAMPGPADAEPAPQPARSGTPLRPTARQRVTHALRGLAEALSALKSETGETAPTQEASRSDASTRAKVRSANILRPTAAQVLAPTRYEREREENSEIVKLSRRGFTPSEIARRLRVPQDQVETVLRMQRE